MRWCAGGVCVVVGKVGQVEVEVEILQLQWRAIAVTASRSRRVAPAASKTLFLRAVACGLSNNWETAGRQVLPRCSP